MQFCLELFRGEVVEHAQRHELRRRKMASLPFIFFADIDQRRGAVGQQLLDIGDRVGGMLRVRFAVRLPEPNPVRSR